MKIQIINKTAYRDDDLRAIVRGACKAAGVAAREVILTVITGKRGGVGGRATLPSKRSLLLRGTMLLKIPTLETFRWSHSKQYPVPPIHLEVARVALHEAMHLAGVEHKDMTPEQFDCVMTVPWAADLSLRIKDTVAVSPELRKAAARADRLEHAQAMLAKAATRRKRAITLEKKWKRRVALLSR